MVPDISLGGGVSCPVSGLVRLFFFLVFSGFEVS